jgi:bacteriorhodopsin
MRNWSAAAARWSMIGVVCVAALVVVCFLSPIPQSQSYHNFADQR